MESKSIQSIEEKLRELNLSFWKTIGFCWDTARLYKYWLGHPEGPSRSQFIRNIAFRWLLGIFIFLSGMILIASTIPGADAIFATSCNISSNSANCDAPRYLGFVCLLFGTTFYVIGAYPKREEQKTAAFNEEIDSLVLEVTASINSGNNTVLVDDIEKEIKELNFYKLMPSEVRQIRLIGLLKLYLDTVESYEELKALAESDLGDYKDYVGKDHHKYFLYRNAFNTLYREHDKAFKTDTEEKELSLLKGELRTHIRELREEVQWEKHYAGQGEALVKSVSYWSLVAIVAFVMLGMTPFLHNPMLQTPLTVLHWGLLGIAGAIVFTAGKLRTMEPSTVGFEEGNNELQTLLLGIVIGGITAILLYAAIRTGIVGGKIFPKFEDLVRAQDGLAAARLILDNARESLAIAQNSITNGQESLAISKEIEILQLTIKEAAEKVTELLDEMIQFNLLSLFWAITAGYSVKLTNTVLGTAEKQVSA